MPTPPDVDAALAALLRRHEQALIGYAARITGDVERARDVVQETLLKFVSDGAPRDVECAAAWLFKVCRNRALNVRRKEKRVQTLTSETAEVSAAADSAPAFALERDDEHAQVLALVAALPERQQEVVRLRFHAGLSYRQIAEVLEITTNNVGVMLHHALTRLREQLCSRNEQKEIANPARGRMS